MRNKTKNDTNWERIFEEKKILQSINKNGYYYIDSSTINKYRQSRLMCKFDHKSQLPIIFKKNNLGLLPVKRGQYIISNFELFQNLPKKDLKAKNKRFPKFIKSIDVNDLYSEDAAIKAAFLSGIIDDLINSETKFTLSGRMGSSNFRFNVENKLFENKMEIYVKNSQIQIDGGFESRKNLIILEAKKNVSDNFVIRQLYYPYRLWRNKLNKKILPIFMQYSNGIFRFYIYKFENSYNYNSIKLLDTKAYKIYAGDITREDVLNIFHDLKIVPESKKYPFPQADDFKKVINLIELVFEKKDLFLEGIHCNYDFTLRQARYYSSACKYLGFVEETTQKNNKIFKLTNLGKNFIDSNIYERQKILIKQILKHEPFYKTFQYYVNNNELPTKKIVVKYMKEANINRVNSLKTFKRRSRTVLSWVNWIIKLFKV